MFPDNLFSLTGILNNYVESVLMGAFGRLSWEKHPIPPMIEVVDGMKQWGCYESRENGLLHVIKLNRDLIFKHPWYAVEDVIRHELAHFLKDWFYPYVEEPAHGRMFRKMCEKIGANPRASEEYPLLDEQLAQEDGASEDESPMAQKIRKLLALSESPNEHEAHLALMKARELMGKYEVKEMTAEENDKDPYVCIDKELGALRATNQEYGLANILNDFYDVRCIFGKTMLLPGKPVQEKKAEVTICGRLSKVRVALYVWDYIWRFMENAWRTDPNCAVKRSLVRRKRDYQVGCLQGIREILEIQNRGEEVAALVRMDADLDTFFHHRFPRITYTRSSYNMDPDVKESGRQMGRTLKIHPGVENGETEVKRLKE